MSMNLYAANRQWATRPADERFFNLQEMRDACHNYSRQARQSVVMMNSLRIESDEQENLAIVGPTNTPATLTHWSFGQMCSRVGAPSDYLRSLPAPVAAQCLSTGLQRIDKRDAESNVLFHQNGSLVCRAFTSDAYSRIWNWQVCDELLQLGGNWRVPPARPAFCGQPGSRPATEADVLERRTSGGGLSINVGDMIAPAGLYASDHDCFAFMVDETRVIEDGTDGGLARGFFVSNSEVGAAAFKVTRFLYRHVCGNHIVWDAKNVEELRVIHTGRNNYRFGYRLRGELHKYRNESTDREAGFINAAKNKEIGHTKDDVIDVLFKAKVLPKKILETAYDHAVQESDLRPGVSPRTAWGFAQGITHLSQQSEYADRRMELDRAAGKVLSIAF